MRLGLASMDNWSKDSAILHTGVRGVGFDSSHRNKNENFAPVTLLTTVDDLGHMVPSKLCVMCSHRGCSDNQLTQLRHSFPRIFKQIHWASSCKKQRQLWSLVHVRLLLVCGVILPVFRLPLLISPPFLRLCRYRRPNH